MSSRIPPFTIADVPDAIGRLEALEDLVAKQAQRITDLEEILRPRIGDALRLRNDTRQAEAARLREAVAAAVAEHSGSDRATGKHILRSLERAGFDPLPAVRTVRAHLAALRGSGNTRRAAVGGIAAVITSRKLLP